MASTPLQGYRVLVTRPAERAAGLAGRIEDAGGIALRFPVIAIEPVAHRPAVDVGAYDAVLFVSVAAVAHGIDALALLPGTAPSLGAVGPATAEALRARGFHVAIEPRDSADSEGLLRAPELARRAIAGRHVLVVRGEGGREALADGLVARGAAVDYAEVYRRTRPLAADPALAAAADIVTVTSNEGLANLLAMVDAHTRAAMLEKPLAAAAARIAERARDAGFAGIVETAPRPGDAGLIEAVLQCARAPYRRSSQSP